MADESQALLLPYIVQDACEPGESGGIEITSKKEIQNLVYISATIRRDKIQTGLFKNMASPMNAKLEKVDDCQWSLPVQNFLDRS